MRLPSVVESRAMRSASSEPPWLNMSSNDCRRVASISRTASPRVPITSASCSALSRKVSLTLLPRCTIVSVMRWPVCSSLLTDVAAAQAEIEHERVAGGLERGVDLLDAVGDGVGELVAGLDHELGELLGAAGHHVEDGRRLLREAVGHAVEPDRHHVLQVGGDLGELVADVVGLEVERRGEPVARRAIASAVVAPVLSRRSSRSPPRSPSCSIMVSPAWPSARVMCSPFSASVMGDAARRLVDLLGDELADLRNVVGEIEMHAVDGVAHLLGLADQRVALAAEILQQGADAHLVVVVGVLERGDLVGDQRLELGGARERALDAVAHGGDLAADRLPDGDDQFARDRLRLGEPHGDLGHRLRDQPHFLRAPRHVGEHVEEHDRRQVDGGEHRQDRRGQAGRTERRLQSREGRASRARSPPTIQTRREDAGENVGGAWTAAAAASAGCCRSIRGRRWPPAARSAPRVAPVRSWSYVVRPRNARACCSDPLLLSLERRPGQGFSSWAARRRGSRLSNRPELGVSLPSSRT